MISLTSSMGSSTSGSFDSFNGGASTGPAFCARVALPEIVLAQPVSSTDAAITAHTPHARVAVPM